MDRSSSSKPTLSQQLMRTFRPRASAAAAPFTSSATATPLSMPLDHSFVADLGGGNAINTFSSVDILDRNANLLVKAQSLSTAQYQQYIDELSKSISSGSLGNEEGENAFSDHLQMLQILILAINKEIEEELTQDELKAIERDTAKITGATISTPPQGEIFKLCLSLLSKAREGSLPLVLRLVACELTTASVKLSDIRANKSSKAVRETRSGAPGSQSSKVYNADHPLASIDRAALYDLVCHLSDGYEADVPTKDNWQQSQLPTLPVQLKALEVLTYEGREVSNCPGILIFLSQTLEVTWRELQILRRLPGSNEAQEGESNRGEGDALKLTEQLSGREWSMMASLHLLTSIIRRGFSVLDAAEVETLLQRVATMFLGSWPADFSSARRTQSRSRSKTRNKAPIVEGYDYYGLDALQNQSRSASPTPRPASTPKLHAKAVDSPSAAPINLSTVAPLSSDTATTLEEAAAIIATGDQPILQTDDVRSVLIMIDTIMRFGSIPPNNVDGITKVLCVILGYPHEQDRDKDKESGNEWSSLFMPVLGNLLRGHSANAALQSARNVLLDVDQVPNSQVVVLVGAVVFLRNAHHLLAQQDGMDQINVGGRYPSESALAPTLSLPLLLSALRGALQRRIDVLDLHVLQLVSDMLPMKRESFEQGRTYIDIKLTQDDWDSLLDLATVSKRHIQDWRYRTSSGGALISQPAIPRSGQRGTSEVIAAMLDLINRLRLGSPSGLEEDLGVGSPVKEPSLAWSPKLAALLLSLSPMLPDRLAQDLIEYYKAHDLCLPCTPDWIANIRALLAAFFHRHEHTEESPAPLARHLLVSLIFEHVYEVVQDFQEYRSALMLHVILPLAQSALGSETDTIIEAKIRSALVDGAAVSRLHASDSIAATEQSAEEKQVQDRSTKQQKIFEEVCDLFCKLCKATPSTPSTAFGMNQSATKEGPHQHVSFVDPPGSHERKPAPQSHSRTNSLNGISSPLPISSTPSPTFGKERRSALDLISLFHTLAFSSPWVLAVLWSTKRKGTIEGSQRIRDAREACLVIFRRLLALVEPEAEGAPGVSVRLTILQWLVRLRTDRQHRVYLAENMDSLIAPAATSIMRGYVSPVEEAPTTEATIPTTGEGRKIPRRGTDAATLAGRDGGRETQRSTSRPERSLSRLRDVSRDRGRSDQSPRPGPTAEQERSSSRNRLASSAGGSVTTRKAGTPPEAQMLWRLPDVVHFEVPGSRLRSDVVLTYTHPESEACSDGHRHSHRDGDRPVPVPVSEYLATCSNILTKEKDWEIISYLLCHMPHQLANKHLFCGPKAQKQVLALRSLLTSSILEQKFVAQVNLPDKIKRPDVYAIAYGTLTTLISYRTLFNRSEQDELVEAFMIGLNKSSNTAQSCVRALSVACYELQTSINRYLPKMLGTLATVMSSAAMSVHILELIVTIAHLPSLYANFTETDYRRIFGIALQYIQYHNQELQGHEQIQQSFDATSFTLAQYVLMLAYYNISLWFMTLRPSDRLKHVESIRKGLLAANEGREKVAQQTEVCFDFLARFTYSNANPRPKQTYLNRIIKASSTEIAKSKTYLFGKCLVTITSFAKAGAAEILLRRPSGTLSVTCRIENAYINRLPLEDGEKTDLAATILMNRSKPFKIDEWTRSQLEVGDMIRANGARGPAMMRDATGGIIERKRRASFTEGVDGEGEGLRIVRKSVDAYISSQDLELAKKEAEEVSEHITTGQDETLHLEETMKQILSETTGGQARVVGNGEPSAETQRSASSTMSKPRAGAPPAREFQMDPGFLALQLSSFPDLEGSAATLLPDELNVQRSIRSIDLTPVVDFHKIGVLYVGTGQTDEKEILGNQSGSRNYIRFLSDLGDLVTLKGQQDVYTGGLDTRQDEHGRYAYVWGDDISQIVYHVTTLMPNVAHDKDHNGKKALIGNDWVRIVWNESGREYDFDTIKTDFNFINVVISPTSRGGGEVGSVNAADTLFYRVSLQTIEGLPNFSPVGDGQLISFANLARFVRILALNSNLVSQIYVAAADARKSGQPYVYTSNWVARLQHIERVRQRLSAVSSKNGAVGRSKEEKEEAETGQVEQLAYDISRF